MFFTSFFGFIIIVLNGKLRHNNIEKRSGSRRLATTIFFVGKIEKPTYICVAGHAPYNLLTQTH